MTVTVGRDCPAAPFRNREPLGTVRGTESARARPAQAGASEEATNEYYYWECPMSPLNSVTERPRLIMILARAAGAAAAAAACLPATDGRAASSSVLVAAGDSQLH